MWPYIFLLFGPSETKNGRSRHPWYYADVFKGTVSRDELNILISTFCVCADGFSVFHCPKQILTFIWFFEIIYQRIFKISK